MSEWISVNDRTPDCINECTESNELISNTVLVSDSNDHPSIGFGHICEHGYWVTYDGEHDFMNVQNVTHWMQLPEPPK